MPWKESSVMEERLRFVARLLDGEGMSEMCRSFGISRKTGYKIFKRYKEQGVEALCDRSRRPVRYANQLPEPIEQMIVRLKKEKPPVVFQFVSVDFTKLFHELVRSLFELVHYCRRELGPGKGPVEPYVSVKLATVTLSCSSELIHKIPRPCIGII